MSEQEAEVGVLFNTAVAADAMFVKNWFDICAEVDLIVAASPTHQDQQSGAGRNR